MTIIIFYLRCHSHATTAQVERLAELCVKYHTRVAAAGASAARKGSDDSDDEDAGMGSLEERALLLRLGAGLFTLQRLCVCVANLLLAGDENLSFGLRSKLYEQGFRLVDVIEVLEEAVERLGEPGFAAEADDLTSAAARAADKAHVTQLIRQLLPLVGITQDDHGDVAAAATAAAEDGDDMQFQ